MARSRFGTSSGSGNPPRRRGFQPCRVLSAVKCASHGGVPRGTLESGFSACSTWNIGLLKSGTLHRIPSLAPPILLLPAEVFAHGHPILPCRLRHRRDYPCRRQGQRAQKSPPGRPHRIAPGAGHCLRPVEVDLTQVRLVPLPRSAPAHHSRPGPLRRMLPRLLCPG